MIFVDRDLGNPRPEEDGRRGEHVQAERENDRAATAVRKTFVVEASRVRNIF